MTEESFISNPLELDIPGVCILLDLEIFDEEISKSILFELLTGVGPLL